MNLNNQINGGVKTPTKKKETMNTYLITNTKDVRDHFEKDFLNTSEASHWITNHLDLSKKWSITQATKKAKKITDNMAIRAAHSLADYAEKRGINPENIVPSMEEANVFPVESADVAMQAIEDGVARIKMTWEEAFEIAKNDIQESRDMTGLLVDKGFIKSPPQEMLDEAVNWAIEQVK